MSFFWILLADIMSRVALLYGEQGLLHEYNNCVAEKLDKKWPETMRKSNLTVGFTRGIRQIKEGIVNYGSASSLLESPMGGLFNTKKHFYRLISLLLTDLGLVFDIKSPSPWQVISELRNQDIIIESDSANLKICLSIANEMRLKAYFANGGQKELFSPLLQSPDSADQSTDDPIFHDFDEDTLVRLLSTSADLHQRCYEFCLKYLQQDEVDANILRNHFFPSEALVMRNLYLRLQNFPKALKWIKSVSKDSPDYAYCVCSRGLFHAEDGAYEKAIECYETALEYSQDPSQNLVLHCHVANVLLQCSQYKKARSRLEKAMKLHDEIYGEGSETWILTVMMVYLANVFCQLQDTPSSIKTLQRAEKMQKRITHCRDMDVIALNLSMAESYSKLGQIDQSLECLDKALRLSHKIFGENNLSSELLKIHIDAAIVYGHCGRCDDAISLLERSLKRMESLYGDTPNEGKIVETEERFCFAYFNEYSDCLQNLFQIFQRLFYLLKYLRLKESCYILFHSWIKLIDVKTGKRSKTTNIIWK